MSKKKKFLYTLFLVLGAVVVLALCGAMGWLAYRHRKHANMFRVAEEAFQRGNYPLAKRSLASFLRADPNNEKAWEQLANILESSLEWREAGMAWSHLVKLNVMKEEYLKRQILAEYRAHHYQELDRIFADLSEGQRREYQEINALVQYMMYPQNLKTSQCLEELSKDSHTWRLVQVLKNNGPVEELLFLETVPDPVIQVEAFLLDAYLAEVKERQLERAEECYRKAADINPELCARVLGNFLFQHIRYQEAKDVYQKIRLIMMADTDIANYAETLFFLKEEENLAKLEKKIPRRIRASVSLRAYVQSLLAYLKHDSQNMIKNYRVAQLERNTPVGLLLSYAVAVESSDLPLMSKVIAQWKKSKLFQEKLARLLPNMRLAVETAMKEKKWKEAAQLGALFLEVAPPEPLAWRAVVQEQVENHRLPRNLIQEAVKRFPKEEFFRRQALAVALMSHNKGQVLASYDQLIAVSKEPFMEHYRKVLFLETQGLVEEAAAELKALLEKDNSLLTAKHALAFGLRTGNLEALHFAEKYPEIANIAKFELERRTGDLDKATKFLLDTPVEQSLSAERLEDRDLLFPLAAFLALTHATERAVKIYTELLPYMGKNPIIELNLSEIYADAGQRELALKYAADAYQKTPDSPTVKIVYGLRFAELPDFEKAITYLSDTTADENIKIVLISCLAKTIADTYEKRRFTDCLAYIRRLQELDPQNPYIHEYLAKLNKR